MVEKMKIFFTGCFILINLCFYSTDIFGQTGVGKLSGKVVDADTSEPLIGANVVIV